MMRPLSTNVQTSEAVVCDSNHANLVIDARFLHWCTFSIFENMLTILYLIVHLSSKFVLDIMY